MEWIDVEFSVDLVQSAYQHLSFLDRVDNFEKILKGEALQHGLKRYEQLWLPLAYKNQSVSMVAPIDIHWLWYIHMLQPLAYRRDCRKALKTLLDHKFTDEKKLISSTNNSIEIWYATFPKEGFNIIRNEEYVRPARNKGQVNFDKPSKLSVDLISLAEAHMHFCYQVALPHFRDKKYLESAMKRYKQFLCLKRLEPDEFLTPSVDILLIWYTHMCNPVAYAKDMMNICGKVFDNNVKVTPALINDRFIFARDKTTELWKKVSGEELVQPGTKLRSSERRREIYPVTSEDLKNCCIVDYKISLSHADLPSMTGNKTTDFDLIIYRLNKDNTQEELINLQGTKSIWSFSLSFLFNPVSHKKIRILLYRTNSFWCFHANRVIARADVDLKTELENKGNMERALSLKIDMDIPYSTDTKRLLLDGLVDSYVPVVCNLNLVSKDFVKENTSIKVLRRTWGHAGFPDSVRMTDHICYVATHKLTDHDGEESFRCRIMHIPHQLHSGVEIFFHQKLVATSHLIGSSQLPRPAQVELSDISLAFDPELGERAMLIRNHNGDWGLCIARWMHDENGGLEVRFMKLVGAGKVQRIEIRSADIEFQSFNANVFSGKILINPSSNTLAENLAVFWSICVLYALCRPRNRDYSIEFTPTVEHLSNDGDDNEETHPIKMQDKNCQFLMAAGLTTEIPSNDYMREKFGSLTYDLLIDAHDIIVEEQKTSRKLLKKDSVISLNSDIERSPVKKLKKKKKRSSNMTESLISTTEPLIEDNIDDHTPICEDTTQKNTNVVKPKKVRKRVSSRLEDMLPMSDDSITKDEVMESKLVKDEKGRRVIVKKISSNLNEVIAPSDDSIDEEVKEREEFVKGLRVPDNDSDSGLSRDGTVLIKEVVEKMKQQEEMFGDEKELEFNREKTSRIKDIAEERKRHLSGRNTTDEKESETVDLEEKDIKQSESSTIEGTDSMLDEKVSDSSIISRESSFDRKKRIAKNRENKFPLSDEDLNGSDITNRRRKRKKSKQKFDVPESVAETDIYVRRSVHLTSFPGLNTNQYLLNLSQGTGNFSTYGGK